MTSVPLGEIRLDCGTGYNGKCSAINPRGGSFLAEVTGQKEMEIRQMKARGRSLGKTLECNLLTVIAEVKKASPSKGVISEDFDPAGRLGQYAEGGAGAISVLTDRKFFRGDADVLQKIRSLTELPVLRKDFILDPFQVYESKLLGADIILLILAILDDEKLVRLLEVARSIGLEAILEVHNEEELERVLRTDGRIIGINNRNLDDFTVDISTTAKLMDRYRELSPEGERFFISESGIKTAADVKTLLSTGIKGVLVGETLMRAERPDLLIKDFLDTAKVR